MITALVSSCVGSPFLFQGDQHSPRSRHRTGELWWAKNKSFFLWSKNCSASAVFIHQNLVRCVSIVLECIGSIHLGSQGLDLSIRLGDLSILPFHWVEITIYWANILLKSPWNVCNPNALRLHNQSHFEKYQVILVGGWALPLWKIRKSVGISIPNLWKVIKVMFQTTNQSSYCWYHQVILSHYSCHGRSLATLHRAPICRRAASTILSWCQWWKRASGKMHVKGFNYIYLHRFRHIIFTMCV